MTQAEIILNYLDTNWRPSWELIKTQTPYGWLGTSADRVARQLAEDGEIDRERRGKYTYYRLKKDLKLF